MRKNEIFAEAMSVSGLQGQIEADFKGWGTWTIGSADVCWLIANQEGIAPELLAVTWANESTFRDYCEPNTNGSDDPAMWDIGPMQINRGIMQANIANKFINPKGIDIQRALDSTREIFIGDPLENLRLGARFLRRIGQGVITGPSETILYTKAVGDDWAALEPKIQNERRAVAYTKPDSRPPRFASWSKYASMFQTFYKLYNV